ncbi:antagonist of mitotic exit network protein 1 [Scheffersomyces coipomensis]|uniref:antagonist of mitotic exit network protein 1 n=1 Tax=Scheffersomyces coipomensis TaxID=1788519 RepID=UPI00315CCE4C
MDINPVSKHKTQPLPYACHIDNKVYDYHPFIDVDEDELEAESSSSTSPRSPKRAKSISCFSNYYPGVNNNGGSKSSRYTGNNSSLKRRLKSICVPSTSTNASTIQTNFSLQEREFSFDSHSVPSSTNNSDISDLESLPDLTEDEYSPFSTPIKKVPLINNFITHEDEADKTRTNLFSKLLLAQSKPSIFEIPELVYRIMEFVDVQNTIIPQEPTPMRRKPLSYNHAFLIHGNKETAEMSMKQSIIMDNIEDEHKKTHKGTLFNCLLVNRLFYQVTREIMSKKMVFNDAKKYGQFIQSLQHRNFQYKPEIFVLHKLFHIKQGTFDYLKDHINFEKLQWLEIYMCPKVLPPIEFFKTGGKNLRKLILTGSKIIDDDFLIMISENCPNLEVLDIRACELVSDIGIYSIGNKCHKLTNINFGRKQKGHLITDTSLSKLISNNKNLSTVGLAGCHISDKTIWELAIHCSHSLERLSLNNCPLLSNQSIPLILASNRNHNNNNNPYTNYYTHQQHNNGLILTTNNNVENIAPSPPSYFQNLSVLELRYNYQISSWQPIIDFKRRQEFRGITLLLELCETLLLRMRQQELEMDKTISQRIFNDILEWANDENDGDSSFQDLLRNR